MILQWADSFFCAAHKGRDGRLHGHTWRVRAYWPDDGTDMAVRKEHLRIAIEFLDHQFLAEGHDLAEHLAADLGATLHACRLDVWREQEGLGATWTR